MARSSRSGSVFAVAALLVTSLLVSGERPVAADAAQPNPPALLKLSPLHAEPDPVRGGRIVDAAGRQVLLRGVNVNALVDYWRGTKVPTTFPFTAADADRMAAIGWNSVRLLVSWSKVEPRPGRYDEAYLRRVDAIVDQLGRRDIYAIIDLHQDAWGPTLAARPGETCASGTTKALGWDGAPGWATLDGGAARCAPGIRELSPAVLGAFDAFWTNKPGPGGIGIRTRYARMLGALASRYATSSTVAGYDVMNEPNAFSAAQQASLADLYRDSLAAIRAAERRRKGHSHLVFFEPSALWSSVGKGAPPDFRRDRNVVYAPHLYTGGFTGGPISRDDFQVALDEARAFGGAPVLSGEWGAAPERAARNGDSYFIDHQGFQDDFRFGATLWTWRESCGDPHKVGDVRAGRVPTVWGEFEVDCQTKMVTGRRRDLVGQLTRAYPRAAPGRLTSTGYERRSHVFTAAGSSAPKRRTLVVFYPASTSRRLIQATGLRRISVVPAPGGANYVSAETTGGSWTMEVRRR